MIRVPEILALTRAELLDALATLEAGLRASSIPEAVSGARALGSAARIVDLGWLIRLADAMLGALSQPAPSMLLLGAQAAALRAHIEALAPLHEAPEGLHEVGESIAPPPPTNPAPATVVEPTGAGLWQAFREDGAAQLSTLQEGLLILDNQPERHDILDGMMRAAHSLKGAARVVRLAPLLSLAHAMEDTFQASQRGELRLDTDRINLLFAAVDLSAVLVERAIGGVLSADDDLQASQLVSALRRHERAPDPDPHFSPVEPPTAPLSIAIPSPAAPASPTAVSSAVKPRADGALEDRVVRVTAEMADRLLGLAGEAVVEAQRIRPTTSALTELRMKQSETIDLAQALVGSTRLAVKDPTLAALLVELVANVAEGQQLATRAVDLVEEHARRSTEVATRLYNDVLTSRMRPLRDRTRGLPRMARDVASALGKRVDFSLQGEGTLVDRDILEKLEAPLGHLVRNALDHGLEAPADRRAAGKPEAGKLLLAASQSRGMIRIELKDDGRGIDVDAVRVKAIARGLVPETMAASLSREELLEFIFLPGFSTASTVSDISGRGVGLDVVRSTLEQLDGSVRLLSTKGQGTTFIVEAPLTRSVLRCLLVRIQFDVYAVPLSRVDRVLRLRLQELRSLEGRDYVQVDDQRVVVLRASDVLGLDAQGRSPDELGALVVSGADAQCALLVDAFLGEEDLVVRRLDPRLKGVENLMAASTLQDGTLVLILDVEDVLRSVDVLLSTGRHRTASAEPQGAGPRRVLVVEDSITVREAERQLLLARGYAVDTAVDGADGWNAVRSGHYDLVITDVDMPRMTGLELVRLIKGDERLSRTPVIIVSYKDREEDRLRGLEAGADAYIKKSAFDDRALLDRVHDLIGDPIA